MKKKVLVSLLLTSIALAGCNSASTTSQPKDTQATEQSVSEESTETSTLDSIGDVKVEKELFDVNLTIPSDFVGETTQEELDKVAEEKGYKSVTLNEDGSATYVMTKSQHKDMMQSTSDSIEESLNEMIGSEDYPNFTSIEHNDDFTEFTVTTKSAELDMNESFSVMPLYMYGGMYNIFNGTPADNVHVDFVNADSGEIIESSDSDDAGTSEQ